MGHFCQTFQFFIGQTNKTCTVQELCNTVGNSRNITHKDNVQNECNFVISKKNKKISKS